MRGICTIGIILATTAETPDHDNQTLYLFKTTPIILEIVSKIRLMQSLTYKEEMIYLMSVKGLTEKEAQVIADSHLK